MQNYSEAVVVYRENPSGRTGPIARYPAPSHVRKRLLQTNKKKRAWSRSERVWPRNSPLPHSKEESAAPKAKPLILGRRCSAAASRKKPADRPERAAAPLSGVEAPSVPELGASDGVGPASLCRRLQIASAASSTGDINPGSPRGVQEPMQPHRRRPQKPSPALPKKSAKPPKTAAAPEEPLPAPNFEE